MGKVEQIKAVVGMFILMGLSMASQGEQCQETVDGADQTNQVDHNEKVWKFCISPVSMTLTSQFRNVELTKKKNDRFEQHRFVAQIADAPELTFSAGIIPKDGRADWTDEHIVAGLRLRYDVDRRFNVFCEITVPGSSALKRENGNGLYLFGRYKF